MVFSELNDVPELKDWINPIYLAADSQKQIQEQFEEDSQISLHSFFCDDKFDELRAYIEKDKSKPWQTTSPPHQRYYFSRDLDTEECNSILAQFYKLIRSTSFWNLVKSFTALEITKSFCELQKFDNACFTLLHDEDSRRLKCGLDCLFYFIDPNLEWDEGWGGYTSYNAEEGELLTVNPCGNTLSLVYCDEGTSRFTKFINYHVPVSLFDVYVLGEEN